jgi:glycosyltransferase involved in cell wall biosynthesis
VGLIVGEGEQRAALELAVRARQMSGYVTFTGYRSDVRELYKTMDLFLFTSHREGLSVAIIEALASGLPIVATDVGGIREQVKNGQNGYVVSVRDIPQMVEYCKTIIANPDARRQMGKASRTIAEERFGEIRMRDEYLACYRKAVAISGTPSP